MPSSASFLLRHFDRLAEAPGGIAKLRALVLQLAVNGKLGTHNPKDEPIENAGRYFKKTTEKESVPVNEQFLETTPGNWRWIRFEWLGEIFGGHTPSMNRGDFWDGNIPWVSPKDMHVDQIDGTEMHVTEKAIAETRLRLVRPGSLFFVTRSGILKRKLPVVVNAVPCTVNQDLKVLTPHNVELTQFIRLLLRGHEQMILKELVKTGTTVQSLKFDEFRNKAFPLPPLAEQRRIVAKVEELMGLCDALEAAQQEREAVRTRLRTSALHQLASPDSDSKSAAFVFQNLQLFTAAPEDFDDIRQSVLQLAIEGKLSTEKSGEDGDALLQQIRKRKLALIASGKAPKEKAVEPINSSALPFEIPSSWTWTRVAWISSGLDYGTSEKSERSNLGVPVVSMGNLQNGGILLENLKRVPDSTEGLPELYLEAGDILFNRTNSAELVGKTGIYEGESQSFTFASYLIRLRLVTEFADPRFVIIATNAPYFRATQIAPEIVQQCGQANVNGTKLANFLIPLPPLAEQRRIVAKVDELMAVLDALEATLTTARTTSEKLLAATIAKLHAA